jgi:SNF2 family DNA or RNA helicase
MITSASPRAQDPNQYLETTDKIKLTSHQLAMLHKCKEIEFKQEEQNKEFKYLVLASKPGSGKSYVILAHILNEKLQEGYTNNTIIVPGNLFSQWTDYIQLFNPDLKVLYIPDIPCLMNVRNNLDTITNYDIILISVVMYPNFSNELVSKGWGLHRVIFDEVDSVENTITEIFPASYTWFVSASFEPEKIGTYSTSFPYPELESLICDCDQSFIDECFKIKNMSEIVYPCNDIDINRSSMLGNIYESVVPGSDSFEFIIIQKMMNVMKFDNIMKYGYGSDETSVRLDHITDRSHDAITYFKNYAKNSLIILRQKLLERISTEENIKKASIHKAIPKNKFVMSKSTLPDTTDADVKKLNESLDFLKSDIFELKQKIAVVLNQINGLEYKADCCGYLIPDSSNDVMTIKVGHDNKCILCSENFKSSKADPKMIYEAITEDLGHMSRISTFDAIPKNMTKMNTLKYILHVASQKHGCKQLKMIIFCDNSSIFRDIESIVKSTGNLNTSILDNQDVVVVTKCIDDFSSGVTQVLLIESNLYGCGLNLECCTDLVLVHSMSNETQVIGRANRLGRTCELIVHKLYYANEISYQ